MTRRDFLPVLAAPLLAAPDRRYRLIAHRGGIVDDAHAENSPGSIDEAISRGYWMIEVDIRRTKDGEPVLQHDATFERFYGDSRAVDQLTWAEVRQLRSKPGDTSPIHFRDLCRMCKGRIRLMLDIKGDLWPDEFYSGLAQTLAENNLLKSAYLLGGDRLKRHFRGKCVLSCNRKSLAEAVQHGEEAVGRQYFLFELGSVLNEESMALCRRHNVTPVAAINTFRYTEAKRDETKGAEEDVAHLKKLGVIHYQIDSRYEYLFS